MISSSKSDGSTMAAAPQPLHAAGAVELARSAGWPRPRGASAAQVPDTWWSGGPSLVLLVVRLWCAVGVGADSGFFGDPTLDGGQLPVVAPALVDVGLGQLQQVLGAGRVGAAQDGEASLAAGELCTGRDGSLESSDERLAAWRSRWAGSGTEASSRSAPRLSCGSSTWTCRCRARCSAVGDHERRPRPGVGLEQRLDRLRVVGAQGDLGHVDVAVGAAITPRSFLAVACRRAANLATAPREVDFEAWPPVFE